MTRPTRTGSRDAPPSSHIFSSRTELLLIRCAQPLEPVDRWLCVVAVLRFAELSRNTRSLRMIRSGALQLRSRLFIHTTHSPPAGLHNHPREQTAAAVYFVCGRASRSPNRPFAFASALISPAALPRRYNNDS